MGRPELPLPTRGPLGQLAGWLRVWRKEANLTYRQLALRAEIPAVTLQRAASGRTTPSKSVVERYVQACNGDLALAQRLLSQATEEQRTTRWSAPELNHNLREVSRPEQVNSHATLVKALEYQKARAGNPTYKVLSERASALTNGAPSVLPISTISDLLRGRSRPRTPDSVVSFVAACGVAETELDRWRDAWLRAFHGERRKGLERDVDEVLALRSRIQANERSDRALSNVLANRDVLGAFLRQRRQAFTDEQYSYLRRFADGDRIMEIGRHSREQPQNFRRTFGNLLAAIVQDPLWQEMAGDRRTPSRSPVTTEEILRG